LVALQKPRLARASHTMTDEALWLEFKKGSERALTRLYERHSTYLYNYGVRTSKDPELVLDCLQELFSRLWSRRQHMAYVSCAKVYLFKSFQRMLFHQLIWNRKLSGKNLAEVADLIPSIEETLINHELHTEKASRLRACVRSLTKGQREVILLRYFNNLSYPEISEVMEMQVGSVYNLASKALESLRKLLQMHNPSA
jgi:RNA polymerase sigma factor (sigma-70 family)